MKSLKFREVKDVLFSKPALCCGPDTPLKEAVESICQNETGSIVVTNPEGEALGIFTERDYLKLSTQFDDLTDIAIEKVMTKNPKMIAEDFRLDVAVGIMRLGRFRHLIVTAKDSKKVIGVVSMRDFFNYFCDLASAPSD